MEKATSSGKSGLPAASPRSGLFAGTRPKAAETATFLIRVLKLGHARVWRYLSVIAILQSINGFMVLPAIKYLFGRALQASNLTNITDRTYADIFSHPVSVLLLVVIAIIALAAVGLQFVALMVMANRQQSGMPPDVKALARDTIGCMGRLLRYPSPLMLVYFFLALPLGGLGLSSVLIDGVAIPPFVTREYLKAPLSIGIYALMIGAIIYVNLRLVLTLPLLVIGQKNPLAALGGSLKATRKNSLRYLLLIGIPLGAAALGASLMAEALIWASDLADTMVDADTAAVIATLCIGLGHILGFLVIGASTVVALQVLAALCRENLGLPVTLEERSANAAEHPGEGYPCLGRNAGRGPGILRQLLRRAGHGAYRAPRRRREDHRAPRLLGRRRGKHPGWPPSRGGQPGRHRRSRFPGNRGRAFRGQP